MSYSAPWNASSSQPARRRRADPPAPARAGRARRLLRHGIHRNPRPVAAAAVPPPEAAVRMRPAGAGARGRQRLVRPAHRATDGDAGPRPGRAACRADDADPGSRPPPGRPRAGRARPRRLAKASAARAPTGTRCARSTCPPRRSRTRCCRWSRRHRIGRLLDIGTGTGRVLELLAPRVRPGAGRGCVEGDAGAGPRAAGARRASTHCAVRLADMYRLPLADAVVRHRRAADGAALRRGPRRRAGRGRARAAARAGG